MRILLIQVKTIEKQKFNVSRSALIHMKTRVSLKYFVTDCGYLTSCISKIFSSDVTSNTRPLTLDAVPATIFADVITLTVRKESQPCMDW